jgi:hypothetical protein
MLFRLIGSSGSNRPVFVGGHAASSPATQTPSFSLTTLSGGVDSQPSVGDFIVAAVAFKNSTNRDIQCTTSGYFEIADLFTASTTRFIQLGVYAKILSSPETVIDFDIGVSVPSRFAVHVWRLLDDDPFDATSTTAVGIGPANPPSITTQTPSATIVAVGAIGTGAAGSSSMTVPSGMENFFHVGVTGDSGIGIASIILPTPQTYDPETFGPNGSRYAAVTMAFKPR